MRRKRAALPAALRQRGQRFRPLGPFAVLQAGKIYPRICGAPAKPASAKIALINQRQFCFLRRAAPAVCGRLRLCKIPCLADFSITDSLLASSTSWRVYSFKRKAMVSRAWPYRPIGGVCPRKKRRTAGGNTVGNAKPANACKCKEKAACFAENSRRQSGEEAAKAPIAYAFRLPKRSKNALLRSVAGRNDRPSAVESAVLKTHIPRWQGISLSFCGRGHRNLRGPPLGGFLMG